jgi:hypothetical protein
MYLSRSIVSDTLPRSLGCYLQPSRYVYFPGFLKALVAQFYRRMNTELCLASTSLSTMSAYSHTQRK